MVQTNANTHPFYGGEAVYWARAILNLDIMDELPPLRRHKPKQNITVTENIYKGKVFPNPAKEVVNFKYPKTEAEIVVLVVTDIVGNIIARQKLESFETQLNIVNYVQAIYFIHVYVNGLEKEIHRFALIR